MDQSRTESILAAFKAGRVPGWTGHSPQHIQTFISNVFLFPETVYKIYRRDNTAFNQDFTDLSDPKTRRLFYEEDFKWNHYFNPSVYQALVEAEVHHGHVVLTPITNDEEDRELVIQMRRIDTSNNLTKLLLEKQVSAEGLASLGYQLTKAIDLFPWRGSQTRPILDQLDIMMRDVEVWAWLADPAFPRGLTDRAIQRLRAYIEEHKEDFTGLSDQEFVIGMDNHSDNVFYEGGTLSLIDIYPPKVDWRFIERSYSIYRLSTDIEILGGKDLAEAFIRGCIQYPKLRRQIRPEKRRFYQLYSALIKAPYLFFLVKKNPERRREAELYKSFIERCLEE